MAAQPTRFLAALGAALLAVPVSAATLTAATTTLSQGQQSDGMVDISVFPGSAGYAGVGSGGTAVPFTAMGDGSVLDYAFYNDDNVVDEDTDTLIAPYAAGAAALIGDFNVTNGPTGGGTRIRDDGGVSFYDLWESTDPAGFAADNPDFDGGATDSAARVATADGSIDVSGLLSGTVYVFYGTFQNDNEVRATLSGAGQTNVLATGSVQTGEGLSGNDRAITSVTSFDFTTDGGAYDTLSISYVHADQDSSPGSRARFAGIVVDGVVPEPSTATLLGLISFFGLAGRRKLG